MPSVILGLLDSPAGTAAARVTVQEARLRALDVLIVHVDVGPEQREPEEEDALLGQLDAVRQVFANEGLSARIIRISARSDAAKEIVGLAASEDAELVVIGLRRRSAAGKALLGSTAHDILMESPCPVLTVRADSVHR